MCVPAKMGVIGEECVCAVGPKHGHNVNTQLMSSLHQPSEALYTAQARLRAILSPYCQ